MPSSTRRFVYRVVRFSVPVTFPVLTGRAGHPRLRDDVGIVPYAGEMFFVPVTFPVLTGRTGHPRLRDDVGIVPYADGGGVRFSGPVAYRRLL